ncbi:MAG: LCP family protein [Chroococcidiopsidaceae cyanobacterium CP_BM_RX_35]|nr:LCP family protein [Chroococcidiopsidaceae cyanobacterium CP_BM_RX_35]
MSSVVGATLATFLRTTPLNKGATPNPITLDQPINILVLGIDNSGHPHSEPTNFSPAQALSGNSDTMLLVRLLPHTHQINILSIPRDTLVQLPKVGIDKVNDANMQGGTPLAVQTVSRLLGDISIDRYVRLDTEGFTQIVDALGGVEVTIPKPMDYVDQTQHLNIHFLPGKQFLNGQHLQEYVRFRHDELGDIGRVQRQQEVLKALLYRLLQPASLLKIPRLLQIVQTNVDTNLSTQEMLGIAQFLTQGFAGGSSGNFLEQAQVPHQPVNMVMLPGRFSRRDEYTLSYWIADPEAVTPILARYFGAAANTSAVNAEPTPPATRLRIAVVNSTHQPRMGTKAMALLSNRGFTKIYLRDFNITAASQPLAKTLIIAQHGNPEDAVDVQRILGLGQVEVESTGALGTDVTVVVGTDMKSRKLDRQ